MIQSEGPKNDTDERIEVEDQVADLDEFVDPKASVDTKPMLLPSVSGVLSLSNTTANQNMPVGDVLSKIRGDVSESPTTTPALQQCNRLSRAVRLARPEWPVDSRPSLSRALAALGERLTGITLEGNLFEYELGIMEDSNNMNRVI